MTVGAWLCAAVLLAILALLARGRTPPEFAFLGGLTVLLLAGVVEPSRALAGFANPGVLTVGALYIVVAGLKDSGAMQRVGGLLLGHPRGLRRAQLRLLAPVAVLSGFINNTPLVAMLVPVTRDWARRTGISASHLLLPMNYAAILGGTCTLIGTSTNLIVDGLMRQGGLAPLHMFDLAPIGVPIALAGVGFMLVATAWLLPRREDALAVPADAREYATEVLVDPNGPLVGRSVAAAGLRRLQGLYLAEIARGPHVLTAVGPHELLQGGDRLVLVGVVDSVVELQRMPGLLPATDQVFRLDGPRAERVLIEAVVSDRCPLVGTSIREGRFRTRYDAVVVALARSGARLPGKLGDIVLRVGDTLLLEARPEFAQRQRLAPDFFLVSAVEDSNPPRHARAPVAVAILVAMVAAASTGLVSMLHASFAAAGAMLLTGCTGYEGARRALDTSVLLTVAAAIGIGAAVDNSGLATALAGALRGGFGEGSFAALAAIYFTTWLSSEFMSNNAAATLMYPLAIALATQLGIAPLPLVIAVIMGASASFALPMGYQTHLMVYGPGGYRLGDFLRLGLPLNAIAATLSLILIPRVFPFVPVG